MHPASSGANIHTFSLKPVWPVPVLAVTNKAAVSIFVSVPLWNDWLAGHTGLEPHQVTPHRIVPFPLLSQYSPAMPSLAGIRSADLVGGGVLGCCSLLRLLRPRASCVGSLSRRIPVWPIFLLDHLPVTAVCVFTLHDGPVSATCSKYLLLLSSLLQCSLMT